ncbi:AlpA family transcriptional regulator [Pseudomonas sp. CDFA 602]|nr:AlpA family transcriptional regulator [Pseudomonas californiensis]MCD6003106.1 AlpA family transcriptional regulator [Pseudomonas californiensis]
MVILRRPQVEKRTGLTKSGIYFLINNGSFPRPVPLGTRAVGWIEAEVSAWLSHKCEKRLTQAVR